MSAPDGFTDVISEKTIELLARGNEATAGRLARLFHDFVTPTFRSVDHWAQFGLLPLCLALLILHENHRAVTEGGVFRLGHVLGRAVAIVAIVLSYDQVCGLITGVAGAGGGWVGGDQYLDHVGNSNQSLGTAWTNIVSDDSWVGVNWDNLPRFLALLFIWVIVMITALFAYVSGLLLSMSQAVLLTIIAAVGKTCIVVSLVPGVGIGKSWARSLAQVAAWSTIAGVISALVLAGSGNIQGLVASGNLLGLLKASAEFVIVGVCTLAVPAIASRILSGGGQVAVGVAGALAMGYAGAKMAAGGVAGGGARAGQGSGGPYRGAGGSAEGPGGGGEEGGGHRAHKAPQDVGADDAGRSSSMAGDVAAPAEGGRQATQTHDRAVDGPGPEDAATEKRPAAPAAQAASGQKAAGAEGTFGAHGSGNRADPDEARTPPWRGRVHAAGGSAAAPDSEPVTRVRPIRPDGAARASMPRGADPAGGSAHRSGAGPAPVPVARPPVAATVGAGDGPGVRAGGAAGRSPPAAVSAVDGRPDDQLRTVQTARPTAAHAGAAEGRRSGGGGTSVAGEIDAGGNAGVSSGPARDHAPPPAEPARANVHHDDAAADRPRHVPSPNVIRRSPAPPPAEEAPPPRRREAPAAAREGDTQP